MVRARVETRVEANEPGRARRAKNEAERERAAEEWIAAHPADFAREVAAEAARLDAALHYEDGAGRRRVFLGDYDSYTWLRAARNYLRSGTVCDAVVGSECRDTYTLAPVGMAMLYGRSLHTAAVIALHRAATWLDPYYPLPASAYLVPVIVGGLGVIPAFAIGRRFGGPVGGFFSAAVSGLHPSLLRRSLGSDNDIWNVVLPLFMVWAVIAGLQARRRRVQIICGALGGVVAGLHAANWRGWIFAVAVVLAGLAGAFVLHVAHWAWCHRSARVWQAEPLRTVLVVTLAYGVATAAFAHAAGADWPAPWPMATDGDSGPGRVHWPSTLALVDELALPTLGLVARESHGNLFFFAGCLGVLLLLLPRGPWRTGQFAVLSGGTSLYLFTGPDLARSTLFVLLTLPLVAATAITVTQGSDEDANEAGTGMIVAVWLVAALLMSYSALRFLLLLAAPLGIGTGVVFGRLHLWLSNQARVRFSDDRLSQALVVAAVLAIAVHPVGVGYRIAGEYLPAIDRAWADTLEHLRTTAPPRAIINTWWDYGYWTKYLADRPVSADGSTLLTHVPHWLARAQLTASEQEAIGLLRMLNCGSDAQPFAEGGRGALSKLSRYGLDDLAGYNTVVRLARLDRAAADQELAGVGLDAAARADVLASTHCEAPPSYLILSSQQTGLPGWWYLGTWDADRVGGDQRERTQRGRGFVTEDWISCEPWKVPPAGTAPVITRADPAGGRRCFVGRSDARGDRIESIVYDSSDVRSAHVVMAGTGVEAVPDLLLVVDGNRIETFATPGARDGIAVLLDPERQRALVGSSSVIDSVYTRLTFLDGRGTTRFRKLDERVGAWGQRVVTWAIQW